jgi:hypothetical protein
VLPKSKYYIALGFVVDAALSRVLADILALPDIPEVESHRLSELCRILNALEGLFVEDTEQVRAMFAGPFPDVLIANCSRPLSSHMCPPGSNTRTSPNYWSVRIA